MDAIRPSTPRALRLLLSGVGSRDVILTAGGVAAIAGTPIVAGEQAIALAVSDGLRSGL
jgi:hypothetical protein